MTHICFCFCFFSEYAFVSFSISALIYTEIDVFFLMAIIKNVLLVYSLIWLSMHQLVVVGAV